MWWALSLNITHWACRRIQPPNCGTASLRLHCVANERSFPSWFNRGVFASNIACNQRLSPVRSTRIHLPSAGFAGDGCKGLWLGMNYVCVEGGVGWGGSTWLLSLLFSLKSFCAAEQKATSRRPVLWVGTAIYFYSRVDTAVAAVVEAAEARLSPAEYLVPTTHPLEGEKKWNLYERKTDPHALHSVHVGVCAESSGGDSSLMQMKGKKWSHTLMWIQLFAFETSEMTTLFLCIGALVCSIGVSNHPQDGPVRRFCSVFHFMRS